MNQLQRTVTKEAIYLFTCMQLTSLISVTAGHCKRSGVLYYMHMTEKHFLRLTNQFQRTVTKEAIYLLTCMQMKSLFSVYRISYSGPLQKKRCMLLQFLHACDWKVFFPSNKAATAGDVSYHMHATLFHTGLSVGYSVGQSLSWFDIFIDIFYTILLYRN